MRIKIYLALLSLLDSHLFLGNHLCLGGHLCLALLDNLLCLVHLYNSIVNY